VQATVAFYFLFSMAQENATAARAPLSYRVQDTKTVGEGDMAGSLNLYIFLGIGAISFFSFLAVATWVGTRLQERQAFYESETLKKIAETQVGGANAALDYLREKDKIARAKQREGLKLGGLVCIAVGLALSFFLMTFPLTRNVDLAGLIPFLVGVALLAYALIFARKD
jgi:hypothetical protein